MWLFGTWVNPVAAAVIGFIGVIGRAIYARGYIAAAEQRGPGAMICGLVNVLLVLGALSGAIQALL